MKQLKTNKIYVTFNKENRYFQLSEECAES